MIQPGKKGSIIELDIGDTNVSKFLLEFADIKSNNKTNEDEEKKLIYGKYFRFFDNFKEVDKTKEFMFMNKVFPGGDEKFTDSLILYNENNRKIEKDKCQLTLIERGVIQPGEFDDDEQQCTNYIYQEMVINEISSFKLILHQTYVIVNKTQYDIQIQN